MKSSGDYPTHYIRFWPAVKSILSIPLAKQTVNRIKSDLLILQKQLCGLSMCFAESAAQTQNDVLAKAEYYLRIATNMG